MKIKEGNYKNTISLENIRAIYSKIRNINNFQKLKPPASCEARTNLETGKTEYIYDEDLDDDEESVFDRLPDNVKDIQEAITCSQGCMLLLVLREHLKDFYGFTTA